MQWLSLYCLIYTGLLQSCVCHDGDTNDDMGVSSLNHNANGELSKDTSKVNGTEVSLTSVTINTEHDRQLQAMDTKSKETIATWYNRLRTCSHHIILPDNCILLPVSTMHDKVHCAECRFGDPFNTTTCFLDYKIDVTGILNLLLDRERIASLKLVLYNVWTGDFDGPDIVDLTLIEDMVQLQRLQIITCLSEYSLRFHLIFKATTFQNLIHLRKLRFNVPIFNISVSHMVSQLKNLKILDFSYTRSVGMGEMMRIIGNLNQDMEELVLNNFQVIGNEHYNATLCFDTFLGTKVFTKLRGINLRDNSLVLVRPGLLKKAPNLKVLDISRNIILDGSNVGYMLEALLHPTLVCLFMTNQGVVGGGPEAYFHTKFTPAECGDVMQSDLTKLERRQNRSQNQGPYGETKGLTKFSGANIMEYTTVNSNPSDSNSWENAETNEKGEYMSSLSDDLSEYTSQRKFNMGNSPPFIIANDFIMYCLNMKQSPDANISRLFQPNKTAKLIFKNFLECLLPDEFKHGPPIEVFPLFSQIFDYNCMLGLKIPFGQSLRKVTFAQQHFEKTLSLGIKLHGNMCFEATELRNLIVSENSPWAKPFKAEEILNSTHTIIGLDKLRTLDFSFNRISINMTQGLASFSSLETVNLSGNKISFPNNFVFCKHQPHLKEIHLERCKLGVNGELPQNLTAGCSKLELLNLSRNRLLSPHLTIHFNSNPGIHTLNLSYNELTILPTYFMQQLKNLHLLPARHGKNLTLDLSNNNLLCHCKEQEFLKWLAHGYTRSTVLLYKAGDVSCFYLNNSFVKLSQISKTYHGLDCYLQQLKWTGATFGCTIFILTLILLFKLRWRLCYQLFKLKQFCLNFALSPDEEKTKYLFDAYVVYADEDRFWVCQTLIRKVEQEFSFKLCIRHRDFKAGYDTLHITSQAIRNSRDTIIVCSELSLSYECFLYELQEAIMHKNKTGRSLIVVSLNKTNGLQENPVAAHILDTNPILHWLENDHAKKLFWKKLRGKLFGLDPGCCTLSCCPGGSVRQETIDENTRLLPASRESAECFVNVADF